MPYHTTKNSIVVTIIVAIALNTNQTSGPELTATSIGFAMSIPYPIV
jgi:hypothetical protein